MIAHTIAFVILALVLVGMDRGGWNAGPRGDV
jgi:hypothetical protein